MTIKQVEGRQRILDAAAEAFGELGFAGARVDDIAARAGVNKATVYYHLGGKEQLYATVVGDVLDHAIGSIQSALKDVTEPEERFRVIVRSIASIAGQFPHLAPLILREVAGGGATLPKEVLRKMATILGIVADVLRHGSELGRFREVDPLVTHMMVAGGTFFLIAGTPIRKKMRKIAGTKASPDEPSAEQLPGLIASLVINGLAARRSDPRRK